MRAPRSLIASLLGLLVAAGAAACGGDGGSNSQPTPTRTTAPTPTPVREARLWLLASLPKPDPALDRPAVLLYSDDLGGSWQSLEDSGLARTTTAFDFFDSDLGVAVGGQVAQRTTDGGRTWTTVIRGPLEPSNVHLSLAGVQLDESGTAIMLGSVIEDSVFNALSYESYRLPADASAVEHATVDTPGLAPIVSMCTTARGVGVGVGGFSAPPFDSYSTTLGTRDAGASWQLWDTISGGSLTWQGTVCAGEQDLWRFGSGFQFHGFSSFTIAHSEDGGRTWDGPVDRFAIGEDELAAGFFIDRSTGWFVGARYGALRILHTTDAGATLVRQAIPDGVAGGLNAIAFANERVGFAAGYAWDPVIGTKPLLLVTRDGGVTWTVASVPADLGFVLDVDVTP